MNITESSCFLQRHLQDDVGSVQTRALKTKDRAAPNAKPSDRKNAMMVPAVSAS